MAKSIDYFFTPVSPYAYMGSRRFAAMAERAGAEIAVRPVDYGQIFPKTGGLPLPKRAPARQAYRLVELRRWRDFLGLPMNIEPKYFPVAAPPASLMITAARLDGLDALGLSEALLRAVWEQERNLADEATLQAIAGECGIEGATLLARAGAADVAEAYQADTDQALALGVFGAPTYVYDGELFWGQDRLDFLERALAG